MFGVVVAPTPLTCLVLLVEGVVTLWMLIQESTEAKNAWNLLRNLLVLPTGLTHDTSHGESHVCFKECSWLAGRRTCNERISMSGVGWRPRCHVAHDKKRVFVAAPSGLNCLKAKSVSALHTGALKGVRRRTFWPSAQAKLMISPENALYVELEIGSKVWTRE